MNKRIVLEKWWEGLKSFEISLEQEEQEERKQNQKQEQEKEQGKGKGLAGKAEEQEGSQEREKEAGKQKEGEEVEEKIGGAPRGKEAKDGQGQEGNQEQDQRGAQEERDEHDGNEDREQDERDAQEQGGTQEQGEWNDEYGGDADREQDEWGNDEDEWGDEEDDWEQDDWDDDWDAQTDYQGQREVNYSVDPYQQTVGRRFVALANFLLQIFAEESSSPELIKGGYDEYDLEELMFAEYTKKKPWECMGERQKEALVLIVDTSGSMVAYETLVKLFSQVGIRNGYVEVYEAPNGMLEFKLKAGGKKEPLKEQVEDWNKLFKNRRIVFLGDFDGGDLVIRASWHNQVVWLCTEERYEDTLDHSWNTLPLSKFKGQYHKITSPQEIADVLKKVLKGSHGKGFSRRMIK